MNECTYRHTERHTATTDTGASIASRGKNTVAVTLTLAASTKEQAK